MHGLKMNNRLLLYSCPQFNIHFSQPPAPNPPHHMAPGASAPPFRLDPHYEYSVVSLVSSPPCNRDRFPDRGFFHSPPQIAPSIVHRVFSARYSFAQ